MKIAPGSGPWAGLQTYLLDSNNVALLEYPAEDSTPHNGLVTKYVKCHAGQTFSVSTRRPSSGAFKKAVLVEVEVDGRYLDNYIVEYVVREAAIDLYEQYNSAGVVETMKFKFEAVTSGQAKAAPILTLPSKSLEKVGTITLSLEAGSAVRTGEYGKGSIAGPPGAVRQKAESVLDIFMTGEKTNRDGTRPYANFTRDESIPKLTINLKYRTRNALNILGVHEVVNILKAKPKGATSPSDKRKPDPVTHLADMAKAESEIWDLKMQNLRLQRMVKQLKTESSASPGVVDMTML